MVTAAARVIVREPEGVVDFVTDAPVDAREAVLFVARVVVVGTQGVNRTNWPLTNPVSFSPNRILYQSPVFPTIAIWSPRATPPIAL